MRRAGGSIFWSTVILAGGAGALVSCEREQRQFHVSAAAADAPTTMQANPVRPGGAYTSDVKTLSTGGLEHAMFEPYKDSTRRNAYAMSEGQFYYEMYNCVGCHAHGGGGIAPPLIDDKWIYGYAPQDVYESIVRGRPNGMPSFGGRIPDYQVWQIVGYVRSLSGQAPKTAAPGREDHMSGPPTPNTTEKEKPRDVAPKPIPSTMPTTVKTGGGK